MARCNKCNAIDLPYTLLQSRFCDGCNEFLKAYTIPDEYNKLFKTYGIEERKYLRYSILKNLYENLYNNQSNVYFDVHENDTEFLMAINYLAGKHFIIQDSYDRFHNKRINLSLTSFGIDFVENANVFIQESVITPTWRSELVKLYFLKKEYDKEVADLPRKIKQLEKEEKEKEEKAKRKKLEVEEAKKRKEEIIRNHNKTKSENLKREKEMKSKAAKKDMLVKIFWIIMTIIAVLLVLDFEFFHILDY